MCAYKHNLLGMSEISISCCVSKVALPYKTSLAIAMAIDRKR